MTTVKIELPDEQAKALEAKATAQGISPEEYARRTLERDLQADQTARHHISEVIGEIMSDIPPEEFENVPRDGASQIDHYLYGHPKR